MQFTVFYLVFLSILSLGGIYAGLRLIQRFEWASTHSLAIWIAIGIMMGLQVLSPILYRKFPLAFGSQSLLQWVTYGLFSLYIWLVLYAAMCDGSSLLVRLLRLDSPVTQRRNFLTLSVLSLISAGVGIAQAVSGPRVDEVDVPILDLPEDLEGFRIAQISDLHIGPTIGRNYTQKVVDQVNSLNPDLIALTGDFVDGTIAQLRNELEPLLQLHSKFGKYYVTGNHEYYWGASAWAEEFERLGTTVLLNKHQLIQVGKAQIAIAGIPDYSARRFHDKILPDPIKAIENAPAGSIKILLAHQPVEYEKSSSAGYHLQLSGHTHAGQFFPWRFIVALFYKYYEGLNKYKDMWIYVNRGTGYWGPPMRLGVPSEISLLRLVRKQ